MGLPRRASTHQSEVISEAGDETYQALKETDEKIRSGNEIVQDTAATMKKLQSSVGKIGKISDRIMQITDQTNLLALNAAIEAARAGEHGRGFTVVAEEIKDLADESMKATKEVKDIIGEVEAVAGQAAAVMISGESEEQDSIVDIFNEINKLSTVVTAKMQDVMNAAEDQVAASEQVGALSQEISASSQEVAAQTQETLSATENLGGIIGEVTHANSKLYFKIKDQADRSQEQLDLINKVVENNHKLNGDKS